mmetsp:Transcript_12765/g.15147  ORF Transcript_12765/g.15147 Transcript_12765/m.15147 type:complete len:115 (+) Transcript_12765:148-492(+)
MAHFHSSTAYTFKRGSSSSCFGTLLIISWNCAPRENPQKKLSIRENIYRTVLTCWMPSAFRSASKKERNISGIKAAVEIETNSKGGRRILVTFFIAFAVKEPIMVLIIDSRERR